MSHRIFFTCATAMVLLFSFSAPEQAQAQEPLRGLDVEAAAGV